MSEYILIIVWIGFVALLANQFNFNREEIVCGKRVQRFMPWFAILVFVPIIWMAGNRGWVGDTWLYTKTFRGMPGSFSELPMYVAGVEKDVGFYIFSALIKLMIGENSVLYFTIIALIQGIVLITVFRKYSSMYVLSVFLFVASTDYLSWMFNGIRQFLAVTIILAATPLMLKKKYLPLIMVILLASTIHQTALIMIPLVFIAQGEAWNKKTVLFIIMALLTIAFVGEFTDFLGSAMEDTQYQTAVSTYMYGQDDGTNILRVVVYSVPAIIALFGKKYIKEENSILINFCTNMSIISMGIYVISMFTSGILLGRLPIYVSLYSYVLLPWEIENLFNKASSKLLKITMILFYLLFYYYQVHIAWGYI